MMTSKIIFGSVLFFSIFGTGPLSAVELGESCKYISRFEQCVVANQNGTALSIKEFKCPESKDKSKILDQVILSTEFQVLDAEVLDFINDIRNDKQRIVDDREGVLNDVWYYLGQEGYYHKQYKQLCNGGLLAERLSCTKEIPNIVGAQYLDGGNYDSRTCMRNANTKVAANIWVMDKILLLNQSAVQNDVKQLFRQQEREGYNMLVDLMRDILGFLERFANGITHWTQNPY